MSRIPAVPALAFLILLSACPAARTEMIGNLAPSTFPSAHEYFEPLLADPTELGYGGRYLLVVGGDRFGEVSIGDYVGLLRWDFGNGHGVQWNLGGGAYARFNLSTPKNQMEVVDFTAVSPVDIHWNERHAVRTGIWHTSSHLGDDYIKRVGPVINKRSIDYVKTLYAYTPSARFRFYGGGAFSYNIIGVQGRGGLQFGSEMMSSYYGDHKAQLFLAQDLQTWERAGWNPSYTLRGGLRFTDTKRVAAARVFVEYFTGKQLFLQFLDAKENRWSLGLNFEIGNPTRW